MRVVATIIDLFDRITGLVSDARRADARERKARKALDREAARAEIEAGRAIAESELLRQAIDADMRRPLNVDDVR